MRYKEIFTEIRNQCVPFLCSIVKIKNVLHSFTGIHYNDVVQKVCTSVK
jgi:hypothetical protein